MLLVLYILRSFLHSMLYIVNTKLVPRNAADWSHVDIVVHNVAQLPRTYVYICVRNVLVYCITTILQK